ncbi:putative sulfate/molybdate transporter [Pleomorphovibrio marinus]|uniref:putative sulfate/molybdate transporter n=1 Tax=Pleomorphovibrio marinus TaxID=2164132 RepID=UPI000E09FD9A|nr:putative sulfate/molybdate transporter [Pleomorphovibrio marinus]
MKLFEGIKFNRQEWAGAFGDIGTDFPLIVAMILAADLHAPSVLILFGSMQVLTGMVYKMPMPAQPLKAMATLVIAQQLDGELLFGAGLAIGVVMLVFSLTGLLAWLARMIPKSVIRGIQVGLGITLALLAFKDYIPAEQIGGYWLAGISFVLILLLLDHKKFPAALVVIVLGLGYALLFKLDYTQLGASIGIETPKFYVPTMDTIWMGFLLLALPQIPLSLGNSILATKQVSQDLFPDRPTPSIKKIGISYALMNLINPFLSGIPTCHGAGGMVGHYTFGGRTGGSVILYGGLFIFLGVFFGENFQTVIQVFPLPVLGVILLFESLALMLLIRDVTQDSRGLVIALLVAIIAAGLPFGFLVGIVVGTLLYYLPIKLNVLQIIGTRKAGKN